MISSQLLVSGFVFGLSMGSIFFLMTMPASTPIQRLPIARLTV